MADISDIQDSIATRIAAALYPNGTEAPSAIGAAAIVYPGWPQPAQLDKDIAAGRVNVSIWARGDGANTTRYQSTWQETGAPMATLTLTATSENTVTIGGTVAVHQVVAINGQPYAVQDDDTLAGIAAALAALLPGATSDGAELSCPTGIRHAAIAANGTVSREVRRQTDTIQLSIWAPTPALRAATGRVLDNALADARFLTMPDGSSARVNYMNTRNSDESANALIYRRDVLYRVEYATTVSAVATQVITPVLGLVPVFGDAPITDVVVNIS